MNFKQMWTAAGVSCLCVWTMLTVCSSCKESPNEITESSPPISIIVPDESIETTLSDNSHTSFDISVTEEEKKKIGTKTLQHFEQKSKIKEIENESETMFSKMVEQKIFRDETHYAMTIYGVADIKNEKIDRQFLELQKSKDCFYCNTNMNILGNNIVLKTKEKMYFLIPAEKMCVEMESLSPDTDIFTEQLKYVAEEFQEAGIAYLDGQKMKYERYSNSGATQTIAYFNEDNFYKMEIYSQNKQSEKEYTLSGYMNLELDLPIEPLLFEIPSDYTISPENEYYTEN